MSNGCIWINREVDENNNPVLDVNGKPIGNNSFEVFVDDVDTITGDPIWKRVVVIDPEIAADPVTLEPIAGIKLYKAGTDKYTIVSSHGLTSNGPGYTIVNSENFIVKSCGILLTQFTTNDVGTVVVGLYARVINTGTAPSYAAYFDGPIRVVGQVYSDGQTLNPLRVTSPSNVASQNLSSGYNLFINDLSTQNQEYHLPDPSSYTPYEEIEIINEKGYMITILPLAGDYLNSHTTKKIVLTSVIGCCKLRSDGVSKWLVTGLTGEFIDI